jgi:hypothetical protein
MNSQKTWIIQNILFGAFTEYLIALHFFLQLALSWEIACNDCLFL